MYLTYSDTEIVMALQYWCVTRFQSQQLPLLSQHKRRVYSRSARTMPYLWFNRTYIIYMLRSIRAIVRFGSIFLTIVQIVWTTLTRCIVTFWKIPPSGKRLDKEYEINTYEREESSQWNVVDDHSVLLRLHSDASSLSATDVESFLGRLIPKLNSFRHYESSKAVYSV